MDQESHIWPSNNDSPLSLVNYEQLHDIKKDLSPVDRIFAAQSLDVTQMLQIIAPSEMTISYMENLRDRSMGTLSGKTHKETIKDFPRRHWLRWERSYWVQPPDGESFFDISDRVLKTFTLKILPVGLTEKVLVIAPSVVLKLIIGYISKMDEDFIPKINIEGLMPYVINGEIKN
jgi:broad specificity phosphatase PhoE